MDVTPPAERLAARYVLVDRIADGGMASVWRAQDEVLAREVALKILHADLAGDRTFLERFRQEAVSAARLSHPRIVRIFDTGTDGELCYIVMELFEGEDLGRVIARGPIEPARAAWLISCALEGLGHAHEQGLVHGDVKPGNILIGTDDFVKVTDFGVARAATADADVTTTGGMLGTVRYLAPEQIEGAAPDPRSDLYAAGVVLYEALTGRPPFDAGTHLETATMQLSSTPMPPRAVRAGIPRELEKVTLKALARDPAERFQSAEDMRLAIGRALGESTGELRPIRVSRPAPEPPHTERRREPSVFRSWMLVPMALVVVTAAVIAAGLAFGRLEIGGRFGVRAADGSPGGGPRPLEIASVEDFDPPGGDGVENSDEVQLAADGDDTTEWETERYDSDAFGGLKSGVGLIVDLGAAREVHRVEVRSRLSGWTFEVRDADDPDAALDASAARASGSGARAFRVGEGVAAVQLAPFRARFVLIWITGLVAEDGGYRAAVSEITLRGVA